MRVAISVTVLFIAMAPGAGAAQTSSAAAMSRLLACRTLAATDARLACYDREAASLGGSVDRGAVVVIDKADVAKAQRARFGLPAPGIDAFIGRDGARLTTIAGTIAGAGADPYGKWLITLADGSRWRQTDDYTLGRAPRAGQPVTISRAAIGSFKMTVAGQATIRVRRER